MVPSQCALQVPSLWPTATGLGSFEKRASFKSKPCTCTVCSLFRCQTPLLVPVASHYGTSCHMTLPIENWHNLLLAGTLAKIMRHVACTSEVPEGQTEPRHACIRSRLLPVLIKGVGTYLQHTPGALSSHELFTEASGGGVKAGGLGLSEFIDAGHRSWLVAVADHRRGPHSPPFMCDVWLQGTQEPSCKPGLKGLIQPSSVAQGGLLSQRIP